MQILKLSKQQYALNKTYLALCKCLIFLLLCAGFSYISIPAVLSVLTDNPTKYILDFEVREALVYDEYF